MAEINALDILRIGAVMKFEDNFEIANVWHVEVQPGGERTYAAGSIVVAEYMQSLYGNIEPTLSSQITSDRISLSNETQHTTFGAIAWATPWQGDDVGDVTAPGVSLFVWARTLKPRVQIRKYLGVYTEASMTNGLWVSATRTPADTMMGEHIVNFVGADGMTLKGVAYNRVSGIGTAGISATTAAEPAYQRRRRRGRGS